MTTTETTVRALLDTAGIECSESELAAFVAEYPKLQAKLAAMYTPAFADADPLLVLASDR
jgi:hypothetical protein